MDHRQRPNLHPLFSPCPSQHILLPKEWNHSLRKSNSAWEKLPEDWERLPNDLKSQWREEQSPGINYSCINWAELPFFILKTSQVKDSDPAHLWGTGRCWCLLTKVTTLFLSQILLPMCAHPGGLNTVLFRWFPAQSSSWDLSFISLFITAGLPRNIRLLAGLCFVV